MHYNRSFNFIFIGTFGSERRPIVEFALEDLSKLRLQKVKLDSLKRKNEDSYAHKSSSHVEKEGKKLQKTKPQRSKNREFQICEPSDLAKDEAELLEKGNNRKISRKQIVGTRKNRAPARRKMPDNMKSAVKPNSEVLIRAKQAEIVHSGQKALTEVHKRRPNEESMEKSRKRKLGVVNDSKPKRTKMSKPEVKDKLDRLIEQYRSKFAGITSSKSKDAAQTGDHKELKRWFELA